MTDEPVDLGRVDELIEAINRVASEAPPPEAFGPIKLTRWQWDTLRRLYTKTEDRYEFGGALSAPMVGRPVELVEHEDDSDVPEWRLRIGGYSPDIVIYDEVTHYRESWPAEPRRGWLRRAIDRVFG